MDEKRQNREPGQRDKFKPYVRLANGRETAEDFRTSIRLSIFIPMRHKRKVWVMVQKGFPNNAMMVGLNKRDLKNSPLSVMCKKQTFNEWAQEIKRYAQRKKTAELLES